MFYDFWVENYNEETKKLLKKLGFSGACVFGEAEDKGFILVKGKSIKSKTNETAEFLILENRDEKIHRAAIKNNSVDGIRSFVNYPAIKEMAERKIALVICFNDLLNSSDPKKTLYLMKKSITLAKKYKTPIVIASGARNNWELRSTSELIGFGEVLGLNAEEAKKALNWFQEKIIERNKLKSEGKYIGPGIIIKHGS